MWTAVAPSQMRWDNLIGLLYIRTSAGDNDYSNMVSYGTIGAALDVEVPMMAVNAEEVYPAEIVRHWRAERESGSLEVAL